MLAGRLPFGLMNCVLSTPPHALQKGRTGESFLFFFSTRLQSRKQGSLPPTPPARHGVVEHPRLLLPRISSPQLCLYAAMGNPMAGDPVRCFSVVGIPKLCFYMSPTAQAEHRLLSGFNVNLGQEPSTKLYPQLSNLLFYFMQ